MGKKIVLVAALMLALSPLAGCARNSVINAYLLDDASVGGDPASSLKPVKGVLVWPLENIAAGSKSKGIETRLSGLFADTVYAARRLRAGGGAGGGPGQGSHGARRRGTRPQEEAQDTGRRRADRDQAWPAHRHRGHPHRPDRGLRRGEGGQGDVSPSSSCRSTSSMPARKRTPRSTASPPPSASGARMPSA